MIKSVNYSVSARDVMTNPEMSKRFQLMKKAGVTDLWLFGYFYGRFEADEETIWKAKKRVEDEGFGTGAISLPVGHPGNSLNPDDADIELKIKSDWTYRVGKNGENEYFCACINDLMIADNRKAAKAFRDMGFKRHFFDDDLRCANWGSEIGGCFCDDCLRSINDKLGVSYTRADWVKITSNRGDEALQKEWMKFQCDKVTRLIYECDMEGMQSGTMLMHNGDERHGLSVADIKRAVPDCMFRVGELQFRDVEYLTEKGRKSLIESVRKQLLLIGGNEAYSESTVFPARAMKPENLVDKIRLEKSLGLKNIFLMSGTWFYDEDYWMEIAKHREELFGA